MMRELEKLSPSEGDLMLKAPLLVCILIAGADDDIDRKEIKKAIQLAQKNQGSGKSRLMEFYRLMAEDFEDKLKVLIQSFPPKAAQREPIIVDELTHLNQIFSKIDRQLASEFYQSLLEIARKTAESSGGLLGLKSVGEEEARFVNLPMIKNPAQK
jgi:hypothetical protein